MRLPTRQCSWCRWNLRTRHESTATPTWPCGKWEDVHKNKKKGPRFTPKLLTMASPVGSMSLKSQCSQFCGDDSKVLSHWVFLEGRRLEKVSTTKPRFSCNLHSSKPCDMWHFTILVCEKPILLLSNGLLHIILYNWGSITPVQTRNWMTLFWALLNWPS